MLNQVLLEEFLDKLRAQRAAVVDALRPGLNDDQIDSLTAEVGLSLPEEARHWWRWHDGAAGRWPVAGVGPGIDFLPLQQAVERLKNIRRLLDQLTDGEGDPDWQDGWLPLNSEKNPIVLDCGGPRDAPVPVRSFQFEIPGGGPPGVTSMGDLVRVWVGALESGAWKWDSAAGTWLYDWTLLPEEIAVMNIA